MDGTQGNKVPQTNIDLSLVSFDDIYNELCKRYDFCVFGSIKINSPINYVVTRKYKGSRYTCLGLLSNMLSLVNKDENDSLGPIIEH